MRPSLKIDFEFREFDYDPAGLLDAVEQRRVDAAIAAIPVTPEGETRFDFSHPYFAAGLGIAVRRESPRGIAGVLANLVTPQALGTVAGLFGLLLLWAPSSGCWRSSEWEALDPRPLQGIGDGIWRAACDDDDDRLWRQGAGQLAWTLVGLALDVRYIFLISLFSPTLASSLVVKRLKPASPAGDLPRDAWRRASGPPGEQWLGALGLQARPFPFS